MDWDRIGDFLNHSSLLKLAGTSLLDSGEGSDCMGWLKVDGAFSVSSAYEVFVGLSKENQWSGWKQIWRLRVQQRVKVFVWLATHERLMTNFNRWKRGLTQNPGCSRCNCDKEDVVHMVRDCVASKVVWEAVLPRYPQPNFFSQTSVRDWIHEGLRSDAARRASFGWKEVMAIVAWCLWRWRNEEVFDKEIRLLH